MNILTPSLMQHLRREFRLDWTGVHGAPHWARVRANGLALAPATGARTDIVELFAFLHDFQRHNDWEDRGHGGRAADHAGDINGIHIDLDDEGLALLKQACEGHSDGRIDGDPTVLTCWDADRLDLGRVGIRPRAELLCTDAARVPEMISWAYERSVGLQKRKL